MSTTYAFIDESGSYGFNFEKSGTSSHFIITAILVSDTDKDEVQKRVELVRRKHFQTGEMKSSSVGGDHKRRKYILSDLIDIDYKIYALVVDKQLIYKDSGLMYKGPFYKYLNDLLHSELKRIYSSLVLLSDKIGYDSFMDSFKDYIINHAQQTLFDQYDFSFQDSKKSVLIQLADFICGTISYMYEKEKVDQTNADYRKLIKPNLIAIDCWPTNFSFFRSAQTLGKAKYDDMIMETALHNVNMFIENNKSADSVEASDQVNIAKYLRFWLLNYNDYGYISMKELINAFPQERNINAMYIQMRVIAKLRDSGVLIASSKYGYKLPSSESEIKDYISHSNSVILPMLSRVRKCRKTIKMATHGELDILENPEYKELKSFFDYKE